MRYSIHFEGVLLVTEEPTHAPPADEIEKLLDLVVAELEEVAANDISVTADTSAGVSVSISVVADDLEVAQERGNGTIRSAFHAAGAETPGWTIDWTSASATREDELVDA